jgi:hypothetical protein
MVNKVGIYYREDTSSRLVKGLVACKPAHHIYVKSGGIVKVSTQSVFGLVHRSQVTCTSHHQLRQIGGRFDIA